MHANLFITRIISFNPAQMTDINLWYFSNLIIFLHRCLPSENTNNTMGYLLGTLPSPVAEGNWLARWCKPVWRSKHRSRRETKGARPKTQERRWEECWRVPPKVGLWFGDHNSIWERSQHFYTKSSPQQSNCPWATQWHQDKGVILFTNA